MEGSAETQLVSAVKTGKTNTWDSIAGYANTKKEIQEVIAPYVSSKEFSKMLKGNVSPIKGMLLFGPPGTGKTMFARTIANETKMNFIAVNGSEFYNKYVGESEKNLREVFSSAKNNAPCVIFFDEIEGFLQKRNNDLRGWEKSVITTFLAMVDGFEPLEKVLIIGATNNPQLIDEAALRPGRFDKLIFVGPPDFEARKAIWANYLVGKTDEASVDIVDLAERTERYTGADIKGICEEAYRENKYEPLTQEILRNQLERIKPSYSLDMQEKFLLWQKKYNRSTCSEGDYGKEARKRHTWDDIKGMDDLKAILKEKIEIPLKNTDVYKKYNLGTKTGVLFFGPPGCGKTYFAKVVADECKANFFTINGPELLSAGIGASEANVRRLFRDARETKPSIIFFDEIDAIAEARGSNKDGVRIINQLLTEMDGMESLDGVNVIAATNRPETLDPALLRAGRFDSKIYIGLPDLESRIELLKYYLDDIPNNITINEIASLLEGYSCADIAGIANKVKERFVKKVIITNVETNIEDEDIKEVITGTKPSIMKGDLARYDKLRGLESI
ncbi:AAA family ATPase [Bacillota bacterium]